MDNSSESISTERAVILQNEAVNKITVENKLQDFAEILEQKRARFG